MNRYHSSNGKNGVGMPSTDTTPRMEALAMTMSGAVCVTGRATKIGRLAAVVPVVLGPAPNTWSRRHVWMDMYQCAPFTHSWSTKWIVTSHGYAAFG
eukprot:2071339-Amphidinium_carterae.1